MRFLLFLIFLTTTVTAQKRVLHYDETTGFDHNTRTQSLAFFSALDATSDVIQDSDGSQFTKTNLATYDLVIFSNTSGNQGLNQSQRDAFEWYIDTLGGALLGIHAATDTYRHTDANGGNRGTWDWFAETLGGSVQTSPNHTSQNHVDTIRTVTSSSTTNNLTLPWTKEEEYYYWENGYLNPDMIEVLRVDETGNNSYDEPRPVAWKRENDIGSRIFYTSLGHKRQNFEEGEFPQFKILLRDATDWALAANITLPVEFLSFSATQNPQHWIDLKWSTAMEVNADFFEVQRSSDGKTWIPFQKIKCAGNSTSVVGYETTDRNPDKGSNFYRLMQMDLSGDYMFSDIVQVHIKNRIYVNVFPNPFIDLLKIGVSADLKVDHLRLYDISGRIVGRIIPTENSLIEVNTSSLEVGIYFLEMEIRGELVRKKLVKGR